MSSLEEVSKKNDELIRKSTASKVFIISRCISILSLTVVALCFEQWRLMGIAMLLLCCYTFHIRYVRYFKKLDDDEGDTEN